MNNGGRRRVVVTGVGMITPLGATVEKTWEGIRAGRSGIGRITRFDTTGLETTVAGEVRDFDPTQYLDGKEVRRADRFAQMAVASAGQALKDAKLEINPDNAPRIGVAFGSGIGGVSTLVDNVLSHAKDPKKVSAFLIPMMIVDMAAGEIAMKYGAKGPNMAHVSAWASSAHAIGGATADADDVTAPAEGGEGIVRAMRMALDDAALAPSDVAYVNAHGTSTQANDSAETAAIKTVFGPRAYSVAVSSTKSMTGHTLGAAGAIEAIFCVLGMRDGVLPPTINLENPDPDCDLDYVPKTSRKAKFDIAMSNSMGLGGHKAWLLVHGGS